MLAKVGFGELVTDKNSFDYGTLELGTETFDLYDGYESLPEEYPDMGALFEDMDGDGKADINNYDIVFINCGASPEYIFPKQSQKGKLSHRQFHNMHTHSKEVLARNQVSTIRDYVENGGTLYITDLSYNYAEQVFPAYIDFLGDPDTPADEPEQMGIADQGKSDITVRGDILENQLKDWLSVVKCGSDSCLNEENQTVKIRGFAPAWAVMNGAHEGSGTRLWVEGAVEWVEGGSGTKPLTASFSVGSGKVIYSSYHTIEDEHTTEFHPQERILQYLVFE